MEGCSAGSAEEGKRVSTESVLLAFDLRYFDGHDLTRTELSVRRHLLTDLLKGAVGAIQCPKR